MYIRKCREMRSILKIEMLEKKLENISKEIDILMSNVNEAIRNTEDISLEEIVNQLSEIQSFSNS
ncbi:hypothetical protein [Clostridium sp.]|uniref:hypothetical protein n=1 Tax=Clostridium sp. TaxID=1506 RepID=UPI002609172F|nr:hypothetical protein [Clostridium sp.]